MMWNRIIWLFILFLLGRHICFPKESDNGNRDVSVVASSRYLELADSADYFISHENWNRAEEKIIQALRLEPANFTNSLLLANLGLVQAQKGEYLKSLESLSMGLNIAPSSTVLLNNRAHTYLLLDSLSAAKKDLDKSLEIDSIQEWTLQTRAYIYLQENDLEQASGLFHKLKNNFPDNSSVYSGMAALAEYEGDTDKALENYKEALALKPEDDEAREAYIFLLINSDKYSEARTAIKTALDLNPENPMFYLLRGYLHKLNYRNDEAQADKKIAISKGLDPSYASQFIP
ncbi:MAG: tetratricopeptide repeat protein [Muribaculaceae bacterium]|nr:tetratricopeptide repeat protein [Muribaculaceae bacterium]